MTVAEIIQIVISTLSLFATITVSFLIYWLQSRHEKEVEEIEKKRLKNELEGKAHLFLSENSDERDYLPWCIIAANLHRHEKHTRKIYTNFCRCSPELQAEILNQAQFSLKIIGDPNWMSVCFDKLSDDIKKYKLGRNYLYDNAKYFHRGFSRYKDRCYQLDETSRYYAVCDSPTKYHFVDSMIDFQQYIDEYFVCVLDEKDFSKIENMTPPADYIWEKQNLGCAEEYVVCYWLMEFVYQVALNVYNRKAEGIEGIMFKNSTEAQVKTFEDKYYQVLLWLYHTYCN